MDHPGRPHTYTVESMTAHLKSLHECVRRLAYAFGARRPKRKASKLAGRQASQPLLKANALSVVSADDDLADWMETSKARQLRKSR